MKARIVRTDCAVSEDRARADYGDEFVESSTHMQASFGRERLCWKPGTVLESPSAFRLVQLGVAEPEDDECKAACGMNPGQIQRAQEKQSDFVQTATRDLLNARGELQEPEQYKI